MTKTYRYTTQAQVRKAFWEEYPEADRNKIPDYSGSGTMYKTDTRTAFCIFVDMLSREGEISPALADRVTLD